MTEVCGTENIQLNSVVIQRILMISRNFTGRRRIEAYQAKCGELVEATENCAIEKASRWSHLARSR